MSGVCTAGSGGAVRRSGHVRAGAGRERGLTVELKKLSRSESAALGNADVVLWCTVDELMELRLCEDTRALYMLDVLPMAGGHRMSAAQHSPARGSPGQRRSPLSGGSWRARATAPPPRSEPH